jgi:hypothetical protein
MVIRGGMPHKTIIFMCGIKSLGDRLSTGHPLRCLKHQPQSQLQAARIDGAHQDFSQSRNGAFVCGIPTTYRAGQEIPLRLFGGAVPKVDDILA